MQQSHTNTVDKLLGTVAKQNQDLKESAKKIQ